jgi:outer membrane protein
MRLNLKTLALRTPAAAVVLALTVFASGRPVFASEQQTGQPPVQPPVAAPAQTAPTGPVLQLTADEAVKLALENNMGLQTERLSPQIQTHALERAEAAYAPVSFVNFRRSANTAPPTDFLSVGVATTTTGTLVTDGGLQQLMRWGGGSYSVSMTGSRQTTDALRAVFSPQLNSAMSAAYTQPLLRNFSIDFNRAAVLQNRNQLTISDLQLQARVTQTARTVRDAYYSMVGAMGSLDVARSSLELANESLRQNKRRVEVGVMASIDIIEAEAEVARVQESVLLAEASVRRLEDILRQLVLNPSQPDFWSVNLRPTDRPVVTAQPISVEAAIDNALKSRTDLAVMRKQLENTDIDIKFSKNQTLPAIDLQARYGLTGIGGTQNQWAGGLDGEIPFIESTSQRSFSDVLRDVFGNEFRNWSVAVSVSYPIGTSTAESSLAQSRLQRQQGQIALRELEVSVVGQVRDAARQVSNSLQRVEATRNAVKFAQIRYDAEQKRVTAGLGSTFQLLNAQQALTNARQQENSAMIDYNRALITFEAIQTAPIR